MPLVLTPFRSAIWVLLPAALVWVNPVSAVAADAPVAAPVVLLANRSPEVVECRVGATEGEPITLKLAPLDSVALPAVGAVPLEFVSGKETRRYGLAPPGIYCFAIADKRVDLTSIDLRPPNAPDSVVPLAPGGVDRARWKKLATIPVKILVDDNEVGRREFWEPRLRRRIEAANEILEVAAGVKLQVIGFDTWTSDNKIVDFEASLQEFEKTVHPRPAAVAIGFTSQYPVRAGRQKMGATRAPLHPWVLVREYGPRISERERVEVLVHELGHFLGAAHSPQTDSVMRPVLGDDQVNLRRFRILFDPLNSLAINLISQQWRDRNVRSLDRIDAPTRIALSGVYRVLAEANPSDPAAGIFLRLLSESDFSTVARGSVIVTEAIVAADSMPPGAAPLETSDERAVRYIRTAAAVAARLPAENAIDAFLIGQASALGGQSLALAPDQPAPPVLSSRPTFRGQEALLKQFVTAAACARLGGQTATEAAVLAQLASQLRNGGNFSVAELGAALAGIHLATELERGTISLRSMAMDFNERQFLPAIKEDANGSLSAAEFAGRYGSVYDPRFAAELDRIRQAIEQLVP